MQTFKILQQVPDHMVVSPGITGSTSNASLRMGGRSLAVTSATVNIADEYQVQCEQWNQSGER